MEIRFTTGESQLGSVLVAATNKGICAVSLRESHEGAEESLRARFPKAKIDRDDAALNPALDFVLARIAGRKLDGILPLDLQGTDFQREVWNQLLSIPPGSTRSYLDVAQAINRPRAMRAVARACGANPVAVVVPCHRVVMSDGSIGGYSGIPGVKKALLAAEGVTAFSQNLSFPSRPTLFARGEISTVREASSKPSFADNPDFPAGSSRTAGRDRGRCRIDGSSYPRE